MKKSSQKTIAQILQEYINAGGIIVHYASFSGRDFNDILSVLNGTADNFNIFYNGGGRNFHIWFHNRMEKDTSLKDFKKWIKKDIRYCYMYKINGKETIVRTL